MYIRTAGTRGRSACVFLFAGAVLLTTTAPLAQQGPTVFSTKTDAVLVDVLVTKDGRPVRSLQADQFELRSDGVLQDVTLVETAQTTVDVTCVFGPALQKGANQRPLLTATVEAISRVGTSGVTLQIVTAGGRVRVRAGEELHTLQANDLFGFSTTFEMWQPTRDAIVTGLAARKEAFGRFLMLLLTDGFDGRSWTSKSQLLETVRRSDAVIYVLTVPTRDRNWLDLGQFADLAKDTGGRVLDATEEQLEERLAAIVSEFRERYVLSFQPRESTGHGWHELDVRLKSAGAKVTARKGYFRE